MPDTAVSSGSLDEHTRRVRRELDFIDHPSMAWRPDGATGVLDVLVVGAGQSGLATAFQLIRRKVTNIRVIDAAPRGAEGPWRTFARMPNLRSPKEFTGPDLDIPCLTYRAWHEAKFGVETWAPLHRIPKEQWADYLDWYRDTLNLPVTNEVRLTALTLDADGLVAATLEDAAGARTVQQCRRVVLATGLDGFGHWWMPPEIEALPADRRSHTRDAIDFGGLAGKTVAVIGAGASAADNAATALEAGAAEVLLLCRRPELQRIQPYLWLTFSGFLQHLGDLPDEWRWRFMQYILDLREGFPQDTYNRCAKHPRFRLVENAGVTGAGIDGDGKVALTTPAGVFAVDHAICGTGFTVDLSKRPELSPYAGAVMTWGDAYTPPPGEESPRLSAYPYLAPDYSLQATTGDTPAAALLSKIHVFSYAATVSFGPSGSSINAMTTAVPKLVAGITRGLFTAEIEDYWRSLQDYRVKQIVYPDETA